MKKSREKEKSLEGKREVGVWEMLNTGKIHPVITEALKTT